MTLFVTVGNSANRDQTMPTRGNQSTPVRWSPVDCQLDWSPVDCQLDWSPVESSGLLVHLFWLDQYLI